MCVLSAAVPLAVAAQNCWHELALEDSRLLIATSSKKQICKDSYSSQKRGQRALTASEREKLHRIYELEAPENFFNSPWFEEICLFLDLSPSGIRVAVFDRYECSDAQRHPLI